MSRKMIWSFILFFLLLFTLIVNTVVSFNQARHAIKMNVTKANQQTIGQAAQNLDSMLDTYEQQTRSLALNPMLRELIRKIYDLKWTRSEANQALQSVELTLTSAKNASTNIERILLLNTRRNTGQATFYRNIPTVFSRPSNYIMITDESVQMEQQCIRMDGEPYWYPSRERSVFSPVDSTLVSTEPLLTLGRLMKNIQHPEQQFVIFLELKMQALTSIFEPFQRVENSELYVIDADHRIVYTKDLQRIGQNFEMVIPVEASGYIELKESSRMMVYQTSQKSGWKVVAFIQTQPLYQDIEKNLWLNIAALTIIFALVGLAALFFRRFWLTHLALESSANEIRIKNELLSIQYDQLEQNHLELSRLNQIKDQVMANTSHELRTPLHSIIGFAESINQQLETGNPVSMKEHLQLIISSGRRLNSLVDDILDMSRLNQGERILQRKRIYIAQVVSEAIQMVKPLLEQKSVRITAQGKLDVAIYADPERLHQILFNLLSNAAKFTQQGFIIVEVTIVTNDWIRFDVKDSGVGIPYEWQQRIFEPFSQVDAGENRQHGGSGLGLSIVRSLVEQHGGQIQLQSEPGIGSLFSFGIPIDPSDNGLISTDTTKTGTSLR